MNYDTYKNNMLKQGKNPVSREEFEMNNIISDNLCY